MTVKELFESLDFNEIIVPLALKYSNSLKPLSEYKENYDIILNTAFTGKAGRITFHPNGDSDVYMIEGDRYFNIVGMEVVLPDNGVVTKEEAAAEILWCSAPFGRFDAIDWGDIADWAEEFDPGEPKMELELFEAKVGPAPERIKQLMLSSSSIDNVWYESCTYGKSDRIEYIADLLLNPIYDSKKYLTHDKKQECICVLYTSTEYPCTNSEQARVKEILNAYFGDIHWQLFIREYNRLGEEVELEIKYINLAG